MFFQIDARESGHPFRRRADALQGSAQSDRLPQQPHLNPQEQQKDEQAAERHVQHHDEQQEPFCCQAEAGRLGLLRFLIPHTFISVHGNYSTQTLERTRKFINYTKCKIYEQYFQLVLKGMT